MWVYFSGKIHRVTILAPNHCYMTNATASLLHSFSHWLEVKFIGGRMDGLARLEAFIILFINGSLVILSGLSPAQAPCSKSQMWFLQIGNFSIHTEFHLREIKGEKWKEFSAKFNPTTSIQWHKSFELNQKKSKFCRQKWNIAIWLYSRNAH